ncbi:MAG: hypothetical protein FWC20_02925 [Oscillospiraceae bacterium]|nr:hypothetical protein [Oscillospiraceae bacterium]
MSDEYDVIWRKGDGEMPDKAKHVVNAAREERLLRSLQLSADAQNTIRYNADKSNKTVTEYISGLVMSSIHPS